MLTLLPDCRRRRAEEKIGAEDYFRKNGEFSAWLRRKKDLYFDALKTEEARRLFDKFVRRWNSGQLSEASRLQRARAAETQAEKGKRRRIGFLCSSLPHSLSHNPPPTATLPRTHPTPPSPPPRRTGVLRGQVRGRGAGRHQQDGLQVGLCGAPHRRRPQAPRDDPRHSKGRRCRRVLCAAPLGRPPAGVRRGKAFLPHLALSLLPSHRALLTDVHFNAARVAQAAKRPKQGPAAPDREALAEYGAALRKTERKRHRQDQKNVRLCRWDGRWPCLECARTRGGRNAFHSSLMLLRPPALLVQWLVEVSISSLSLERPPAPITR